MYKLSFQFVLIISLLFTLLVSLGACGSEEEPAPASGSAVVGNATAGEKVYQGTCIACHGPDAKGVENLGKSLHPSDSDFVSSRTDDELVEYIKVGRALDDPLNTTGIVMPPKGGNPLLSDQEMYDVVAFVRTLK